MKQIWVITCRWDQLHLQDRDIHTIEETRAKARESIKAMKEEDKILGWVGTYKYAKYVKAS